MSIDLASWDALTATAERLHTTRTALIRRAVTSIAASQAPPPTSDEPAAALAYLYGRTAALEEELSITRHQLASAQHQLAAAHHRAVAIAAFLASANNTTAADVTDAESVAA